MLVSEGAAANEAAGTALFDEGRRLMGEGKYQEACEKFEKAEQLREGTGILLNLAACYEKIGKTASAWTAYRSAAASAASRSQPQKEHFARDRAKRLEGVLCRLTIDVPDDARVEGLSIQADGEPVPESLWGVAQPIDPGRIEVAASAPGKVGWATQVEIKGEGATASLVIPPLKDDPTGAAAPPVETSVTVPKTAPDDTGVRVRDPGKTQRIVGWSAVGGGAAVLGAGLAVFLKAQGKFEEADCLAQECATRADRNLWNQAQAGETAGIVVMGVGGALVATGFLLVAIAPSKPSHAAWRRYVPSASVGRNGAALSWGASF